MLCSAYHRTLFTPKNIEKQTVVNHSALLPLVPQANLFARLFTCLQAKLTLHVSIDRPASTFYISPRVGRIVRQI